MAGYRFPSCPVRLQACNLPQEANMEYGLDIRGIPCFMAISITSWGGFFFLTMTTAHFYGSSCSSPVYIKGKNETYRTLKACKV
jgi:hypothetical protein